MTLVKIHADEYAPKDATKKLTIQLSPYDIPREVKGEFDKTSGIFHIYFLYPDQEESVAKKVNDQLSIKAGKHSGKILGLEIKVLHSDVKSLTLKIVSAMDGQIPKLTKFNERENYRLIRSVLEREQTPIFAELAD